jgi:hypothetical protein
MTATEPQPSSEARPPTDPSVHEISRAASPSARRTGGAAASRITARLRRDLRLRAMRTFCPWCGAVPGEPCVVPRLGIPIRSVPAHEARLIAVGIVPAKKAAG